MPRPMQPSHGEVSFREPVSADARNVAAQVLGSAGLPSIIDLQRLDAVPAKSGVESADFAELARFPESFKGTLLKAHAETVTLFGRIGATIPTLQRLQSAGCIDESLAASYEQMQTTAMQPELVIAPIDMPLNTFKTLFNAMTPIVTTKNGKRTVDNRGITRNPLLRDKRLKISGFSVCARAVIDWDTFTDPRNQCVMPYHEEDDISWTVRVVEGKEKALLAKKNYKNAFITSLSAYQDLHFSTHIGEYLVMQARRIQRGEAPVDASNHTQTFRTWLAGGQVSDYENRLVAPIGYWDPFNGRIAIETERCGVALGVRQVEWSRDA